MGIATWRKLPLQNLALASFESQTGTSSSSQLSCVPSLSLFYTPHVRLATDWAIRRRLYRPLYHPHQSRHGSPNEEEGKEAQAADVGRGESPFQQAAFPQRFSSRGRASCPSTVPQSQAEALRAIQEAKGSGQAEDRSDDNIVKF
jgi:hypothetical protein